MYLPTTTTTATTLSTRVSSTRALHSPDALPLGLFLFSVQQSKGERTLFFVLRCELSQSRSGLLGVFATHQCGLVTLVELDKLGDASSGNHQVLKVLTSSIWFDVRNTHQGALLKGTLNLAGLGGWTIFGRVASGATSLGLLKELCLLGDVIGLLLEQERDLFASVVLHLEFHGQDLLGHFWCFELDEHGTLEAVMLLYLVIAAHADTAHSAVLRKVGDQFIKGSSECKPLGIE
mmetsp:Transcript_12961/g.39185  ORF Transcript_12961/g.39185 Transcript_12961/m.39185 type:complete len:234 (+) Transcript_12961:31-732(+)